MAKRRPEHQRLPVLHHAQGLRLPPNYTIFGKLTSGEEVVDVIATAPAGASDRPHDPVAIISVSIAEG